MSDAPKEPPKEPPFSRWIGLTITELTPERARAELVVRPEMLNRGGNLHGGAIMALADILGGSATNACLPEGTRTTTIESKTNFFAPVPAGETAYAESIRLHGGRTTMVWETKVTRADGRLAALVIQTQILLPKGS